MRIACLVPSATEALFALGAGDRVVAVTHECDHPAEALALPRLTRSVIPPGLEPGEIDARVREITGRGEALYELDEAALARLSPDLVVTQALCAVCAVSYDDVRAVADRLPSRPRVVSLDPSHWERCWTTSSGWRKPSATATPAKGFARGFKGALIGSAIRSQPRLARECSPSSGSTRPTPPGTGCRR